MDVDKYIYNWTLHECAFVGLCVNDEFTSMPGVEHVRFKMKLKS